MNNKRPQIGVYICHCGINIAQSIDVAAVADYAATLPNVTVARHYLYMCSQPGQSLIREDIASGRVNRVVVASCSPRMHETTFRNACQQEGLNPYYFEQANIREQCSWVNPSGEIATAKAKELVRAAVQRVALHKPLDERSVTIAGPGLVIGGGVAGLTAALMIADAGFPVTLIEKSDGLGGNAMRWFRTFPTLEVVEDMLAPLIERIENHPNVRIMLNSTVTDIEGYIGHFTATVTTATETEIVPAATIIVAIGYQPFDPNNKPELGYGKYLRVVSSIEIEEYLRTEPEALADIKDVVIVSCVGSRDKQVGNPYCSRVCCMVNMKQAYLLRQHLPNARITVLYIDVRAFGKGFEEFYDQVRTQRINYRRGNVSEILQEGDHLVVKAEDTLLQRPISLKADLVILGVGLIPRPEHQTIATLFKLARSADGFFMEKHPKLGPVETMMDGIYLAGSCQSPKDITDTVAHARAAASAALVPMLRGDIMAEATISNVTTDMCAGCGLCVANCPYSALTLDTRLGIVRINEALCKGCGACSNICPSNAIKVQHFKPEQIMAQIDALLASV